MGQDGASLSARRPVRGVRCEEDDDLTQPEIGERLMSFAGRSAVVTGAAGGIGAGLVRGFAAAGAHVFALDLDGEHLAAAYRQGPDHGRIDTAAVDVSDWGQVAAVAAQAAREFGGLDVWINCAGVFPYTPLAELTAASLAATMAVNLAGAVAGAQASARYLRDETGSVLNISSIAATRARPGRLAYGASKAALEQATRCLAAELAPRRIRANAIAPGYIDTAMLDWIRRDPEITRQATQEVPLGRIGQVEDIVNAALFLASTAAAYITGVVLPVDGGLRSAGSQLT